MTLEQEKLVKAEVLNVLAETLNEMDFRNYSTQISMGTQKGRNFLGIIAQLQINGYNTKGNSVQKNFIIKSAPHDEEYRKLAYVEDCFIREIYIYEKLLPEFEILQMENEILNYFKSYPTFYKSSSNSGTEALILEDVKSCGYNHYDREKIIDYDHICLLMQELGKFHALSYATRIQKPQLFKDIINNTQETSFHNFGTECIRSVSKHRVNLVLKSLDPTTEIYYKFKQFEENMFEILSKCIDSKLVDEYAVINHGDFALSNILFKYEDLQNSNKPTDVCFLDWQMARLGSPALDLTTIIFSSTDKKLRDEHYKHFIDEYYNSLCSMLKQFGCEGEQLLPYNILLHHLKKYSIFGLYWAILIIYVQLQNIADTSSRTSSDSNPFCYDLKDLQQFCTRTKDLVLDFEELGYNFKW